jgi:uncharacterized protein
MNVYFLDTSALVKCYVPEVGSAWMQGICAKTANNLMVVARITWVEVLSALARRQRGGTLTASDVTAIATQFRADWNSQYRVVELNQVLAESAGNLLGQYPLRAYDAVQLASALSLVPAFATTTAVTYTFLSSDNNLVATAQSCGLQTENPNRYP